MLSVESLEVAPKGIYLTVLMDDVCEADPEYWCLSTVRYNLFADSKSSQFEILEKKVLEERQTRPGY